MYPTGERRVVLFPYPQPSSMPPWYRICSGGDLSEQEAGKTKTTSDGQTKPGKLLYLRKTIWHRFLSCTETDSFPSRFKNNCQFASPSVYDMFNRS